MSEEARQLLEVLEQRSIEHVIGLLAKRLETDDTAWPVIEEVHAQGAMHHLVQNYTEVFLRREIVRKKFREFFSAMPKPGENDDPEPPTVKPFTEAKKFMDQAGPGNGDWMPSELFEIGRATLRSGWRSDPDVSRKQARLNAEHFERWAIDLARSRYREGLCADPFTNNPRRRTA